MLAMAADTQPVDARAVPVGPVLGWLAVQLGALVVSAARVPLSARFPRPAEELAVHVLLVVQIATASFLFPLLLRNVRSLMIAALTALPLLQLASYLAGTDPAPLVRAAGYLIAWLIGLAIWLRALPSRAARLYGVAVAAALAIGGPILWYARAELARGAADMDWSVDGSLGPTMGALAQLEQPSVAPGPWIMIGAFVTIGATLAAAVKWRARGSRTRPSG
jgi:hypothetical protein